MSRQLPNPYLIAGAVAGVGLIFASWWLSNGAQWVAQRLTDTAPEGGTVADTLVAGTAGLIGEAMGLPTPRQIAEHRDLCTGASTWFDASVDCSAGDFFRWLRGDFDVRGYHDEVDRLSGRYPAPASGMGDTAALRALL
jgi:hypothetical protein